MAYCGRIQESQITLSNGGDFPVIIGFLVIAMNRPNIIHLDGLGDAFIRLDRLGDTDADFGLSPTTSRAATL